MIITNLGKFHCIIVCKAYSLLNSNIVLESKIPVLVQLMLFICLSTIGNSQEIYSIQSFQYQNSKTFGFVSMTDIFRHSHHPDSLVIDPQNLGDFKFEDDNAHTVNEPYRTRFLSRLNIAVSDSIFIYSFKLDRCFSFPLSGLNLVAHLTMYGPDFPITQDQYLIGFEFGKDGLPYDLLGEYYYNAIASIASKNPFQTGETQRIIWEKTLEESMPDFELPEIAKRWKNEWIKTVVRNEVYRFTSVFYVYYLQSMERETGGGGRHLLVANSKTGKVIFNTFYFDSEGTYLLPLSGVDEMDNLEMGQWTGKLFPNKPPIIYGFYGNSFGCPSIDFIDKDLSPIYIRCDNRH